MDARRSSEDHREMDSDVGLAGEAETRKIDQEAVLLEK